MRGDNGRKEQRSPQVLAQLGDEELKKPASKWSTRHLIAYRLLVQQEKPFLGIFKANHDRQCPVCKPHTSCLQKVSDKETADLTQSCPRNLLKRTESELLKLPGGFFWAALARAARPEQLNEARAHSQRERRPVEREGYVNSTDLIPASSSPTQPSSSEYEVNMSDMDEDEHDGRRGQPEEVTVHLVGAFIQYALNLCLMQTTAGGMEVRLRVERKRSTISVAGRDNITAEDDGGICSMELDPGGWVIDNPYLALLEAKRSFKHIHIDERGNISPLMSNETVAQYLGEAVITWKANQDSLGQG